MVYNWSGERPFKPLGCGKIFFFFFKRYVLLAVTIFQYKNLSGSLDVLQGSLEVQIVCFFMDKV